MEIPDRVVRQHSSTDGGCELPAVAEAQEGRPCAPEPIDMRIVYGDLITCQIDPPGDVDFFRFTGTEGESVVIHATRQTAGSGASPCLELRDPDGLLVFGECSF